MGKCKKIILLTTMVLAITAGVLAVGLAYERGHNNGYNEGWNDGMDYGWQGCIEETNSYHLYNN